MTKKRKASAKTTALIVDGAYARIQSRVLGGKVEFARLRMELEEMASTEFEECWYFDSQRCDARGNSALAAEYHALKFALPLGPQFQVQVFSTKRYNCHCPKCGNGFTQNVQKGVDNGIATKLLTLATVNHIERVILFSGDGDFYTSLGHVRNVLRREVWVVGFWGTMSGDLQQLASRIIWVNDLWGRVKYQGRKERGRTGALPQLQIGLPRRDGVYSSSSHHRSNPRTQRRRRNRHNRQKHRKGSHQSDTLNIYEKPPVAITSPRAMPSERLSTPIAATRRQPRERLSVTAIALRNDSDRIHQELPLFDEVNLSGSEEGDNWSPLVSSEEDEDEGRSTEPVPTVNGEQRFNFPLPMAVPVATPSTTSADGVDRPHRIFEWVFGANA